MSKKTAAELACEELARTSCALSKRTDNTCSPSGWLQCKKCWAECLKQQADISDGWDILIELFNKCKEKTFKLNIYNDALYSEGFNDALDEVSRYIKDKLKQNEVNNE